MKWVSYVCTSPVLFYCSIRPRYDSSRLYDPNKWVRLEKKHPNWGNEPIVETFTKYAQYVLLGDETGNADDDHADPPPAAAKDEMDPMEYFSDDGMPKLTNEHEGRMITLNGTHQKYLHRFFTQHYGTLHHRPYCIALSLLYSLCVGAPSRRRQSQCALERCCDAQGRALR